MPISDLLTYHDDELHKAVFPPVDPLVAAREKFAKAVEATVGQIANGRKKIPNRMWTLHVLADGKKAIEFTAKFNGSVVKLDKTEKLTIPEKRYAEFVKALATAIRAKDFDPQLNLALASSGAESALAALTGKAPKGKGKGSRTTTGYGLAGSRIGQYLKNDATLTREQLTELCKKATPTPNTDDDIAEAFKRRDKRGLKV